MSGKIELLRCPVCGKDFVPAPQHVYKLAGEKKKHRFVHTGVKR